MEKRIKFSDLIVSCQGTHFGVRRKESQTDQGVVPKGITFITGGYTSVAEVFRNENIQKVLAKGNKTEDDILDQIFNKLEKFLGDRDEIILDLDDYIKGIR